MRSDNAHISLRFRLFQGVILRVSAPDTVHITCRNGALRVTEKIASECKLLIYRVLREALIFRVFVSEGKSARKFSFIFWGRTENSDVKTAGY